MRTALSSKLRRDRGFTLIELVVSMSAALVVTLAVIGLSHTVTSTFNDEMRSSSAEASLRNAVDRLRQDLERASFMSSGDYHYDPKLFGKNNIASVTAATNNYAIDSLAGIRIYRQAGTTATAPFSANNGLTPDIIDITGNMTTSDQFAAAPVAGKGAANSNCGGQQLTLKANSGAMYRVVYLNATTTSPVINTQAQQLAILKTIFQPISSATATGQTFVVRVLDLENMTVQYGVTCPTPITGPNPDGTWNLNLSAAPTLSFSTSGVSGKLLVNPVHTVQYRLDASQTEYAQTNDPTQLNLYRRYVYASATATNAPSATECSSSTVCGPDELIAEYAIDMKFGLNVDDSAVGLNGAAPTSHTFDFDDTNIDAWAGNVSSLAAPGVPGPQRIRSVRVRLATRSRSADRNRYVAGPAPGFLYLYCADNASVTVAVGSGGTCKTYARVRTLTTDVVLANQAGFLWP